MSARLLLSPSLRYFVEVAKTGSLAAASDNLHVAVSALSRQIKRLEEQADAPLFERRPRGMHLTEAGEILLAFARRSLAEGDSAVNEIYTRRQSSGVMIRVACSEGFANDVIPTVMSRFLDDHPRTRFSLTVTGPSEIAAKVREGEVDVGLLFTMLAETNLQTLYCAPAPICAMVPSRHPLHRYDSLQLKAILDFPVVLSAPGTSLRDVFDSCCAILNRKADTLLDSNSSSASLGMALRTGAIFLTSRATAPGQGRDPRFKVIPIDDEHMRTRIVQFVAMEGRTLNPALHAFVAGVIEMLASTECEDAAPAHAEGSRAVGKLSTRKNQRKAM